MIVVPLGGRPILTVPRLVSNSGLSVVGSGSSVLTLVVTDELLVGSCLSGTILLV